MSSVDNHYNEVFAQIQTRRILWKYGWLIEPSRKHSVNMFLLQSIIDFLEQSPNLKSEAEYIKVGMILKNCKTHLNKPLIERNPFHVTKYSNFIYLKQIVDGNNLCYLLDSDGMVVIGQIPEQLQKQNSRDTLMNVSFHFQTMAFHTINESSEIYDEGKIIQINRNHIWTKPPSISFTDLENQGFPSNVLVTIFQICLKMSEKGKGGTFAIVVKDCQEYCLPMIDDCTFKKSKIEELSQNQIIELASVDGAVVLTVNGDILNFAQRLCPPIETPFDKEGRGTRHNSAAQYSNAVESVVFVVSGDGPISVYRKGSLYARCFGELFGP